MAIEWLKPGAVAGSILYALIGVAIFWICFVIVDKLTPYDLWAEIIEKKNVALAIVVGSNSSEDCTSSRSTSFCNTSGTPTLASLAIVIRLSAKAMRPLNCHR